jgi:soluble lytic murein transglycosylase-like protein
VKAALTALAVGLLAATAAGAQVIEIQDDGAVVTYRGPTRFDDSGAHTLTASPPPSAGRPSATPSPVVADAIRSAAARHQISPQLVEAVAWRESGFNPLAVSPKGARGVMQLMPGTARALGVDAGDPMANIEGGADYLSRMMRRFDGNLVKTLAAYNAGPEAVDRYGGLPPYAETTSYVRAILRRLGQPAGAGAALP